VSILRLFLDTNVYILGAADSTTPEGRILNWLEQVNPEDHQIELLVSGELLDQVARVAKRLTNKDKAGQLINRILTHPKIFYIALNDDEIEFWLTQGTIPREDIEIYLTAKTGNAQCFVSSNHKLIRALVEQSQEFECLTPAEFVSKYLPL
jgi:predicted nucleic acid-binding protein